MFVSVSVIYNKGLVVKPNDRMPARNTSRTMYRGETTHENLLRSEATLPNDPSSLLSSPPWLSGRTVSNSRSGLALGDQSAAGTGTGRRRGEATGEDGGFLVLKGGGGGGARLSAAAFKSEVDTLLRTLQTDKTD